MNFLKMGIMGEFIPSLFHPENPSLKGGDFSPLVKNAGASMVVISCAGCYRTMKKDFEKFGADYDFEIFYTMELMKSLLEKGQIKFKREFNKKVIYYDLSQLGRNIRIYDFP